MIFAPCERVIISNDNLASIISVMESVQISVPADLPVDALVPLNWAILSLWRRDEDTDVPIEFEEQCEVIRQDGIVALVARTLFTVTNSNTIYRTVITFPALPVGRPGTIWIKDRIRQTNHQTDWVVSAEFPLIIVHAPVAEPNAVTQTPPEQPQLPTS